MQYNLIFSEIYLDDVLGGMLPFISIFVNIYIYIYIYNVTNNGTHPSLTTLSTFCTSLYCMRRLKWATLPQWSVIKHLSLTLQRNICYVAGMSSRSQSENTRIVAIFLAQVF
jgi:hypothetical protein